MIFKYFESWKVYQASSLGDINRKTGKRGNHPFIYLKPHPNEKNKSYGIMLTTKNRQHAVLSLENVLGNKETQNILLANIGFIDNSDIIGFWIYSKNKSHATINAQIKQKIIDACELSIELKSIQYPSYFSIDNNKQKQIEELSDWIKDLQEENELLKLKIKSREKTLWKEKNNIKNNKKHEHER